MAGKGGVPRLFARHKSMLLRELDVDRVVPRLVHKELLSRTEANDILSQDDKRRKCETFLEVMSKKGISGFHEFCAVLEEIAPHLLTNFLLETPESIRDDKSPTKALQLGFELALKERDAVLRQNAKAIEERDQAIRELQELKASQNSVDNIGSKTSLKNNLKSGPGSPTTDRRAKSPIRKGKIMGSKPEDSDSETDDAGFTTVTNVPSSPMPYRKVSDSDSVSASAAPEDNN